MKAIAPAERPFSLTLAAAALTLLGACAAPPPPAAVPLPAAAPPAVRPAPLPAPAPVANWRDVAITPGVWRWGMADGKSTATFGPPGGTVLVRLTCEKFLREVRLARVSAGTGHVPMAVTTTTGTRPLLSEPTVAAPGWIVAQIRAGDPILDAIAFSRGRFALDVAGEAPLYLPSWPEIARVVEDCR
ncbi:hypothetical protein [Novosphingobium sp.]|uniref:hypothetical protein n=1 Tax=Novosphingobium sp. TaxID=1874826 RepID=UPI00273655E2|nr:hypothetical protein [Novosphingobium sp.]MDP3907048.1 hypothetical protein [Novosphingobium sp.]